MNSKCGILLVLLVVFLVSHSMPAFADSRCAGVAVAEVRSLKQLPEKLRQLLPSETTGMNGIADSDARFNAGDAVDVALPMQKFVLAAVGPNCAVVAVMHGGVAEYTSLTEYRLAHSEWAVVGEVRAHGYPKSVQDLLTWQGR